MRGLGSMLSAALLLVLAGASPAMADDTTADVKPPVPQLSDILEASGLTATGYLDGTYSYLSQSPAEGPARTLIALH